MTTNLIDFIGGKFNYEGSGSVNLFFRVNKSVNESKKKVLCTPKNSFPSSMRCTLVGTIPAVNGRATDVCGLWFQNRLMDIPNGSFLTYEGFASHGHGKKKTMGNVILYVRDTGSYTRVEFDSGLENNLYTTPRPHVEGRFDVVSLEQAMDLGMPRIPRMQEPMFKEKVRDQLFDFEIIHPMIEPIPSFEMVETIDEEGEVTKVKEVKRKRQLF